MTVRTTRAVIPHPFVLFIFLREITVMTRLIDLSRFEQFHVMTCDVYHSLFPYVTRILSKINYNYQFEYDIIPFQIRYSDLNDNHVIRKENNRVKENNWKSWTNW